MSRYFYGLLLAVCGIIFLPAAGRAEVIDRADFFSHEYIELADKRIEDLKRSQGKDLRIETIKAVPEAWQKKIKDAKTPKEKAKLFEEFSQERLQGSSFDGVYILLCLEPKYLHVTVFPESNGSLLTEQNRVAISKKLQEPRKVLGIFGGRETTPNHRLLETINLVGNKLTANHPADDRVWIGIYTVIGCILLAWVVLGLIRVKLVRRGQSADPAGGITAVAATGMNYAVLGGIPGSMAGEWLCDVLFRRRPEPEPAPHEEHRAPEGEQPEEPPA
jgi:hypothetical protein